MAAIDKIYITGWKNYCAFYDWVCNNNHELTDKYGKKVQLKSYLRKFKNAEEWAGEGGDSESVTRPVMYNPCYVDAYIIRNCPLDFIQKELMVNYGHWSQERIKEFHDEIKNWNVKEKGECPYWAKLDDFLRKEDGTLIIKGLEKSDYEKILDGELYDTPYKKGVEYGRHFVMTKSPRRFNQNKFERPARGNWMVNVETPKGMSYMWHHRYGDWRAVGTWDFMEEFVDCDGSSSCTHANTITSLKRKIRKWKLPVGTKVSAIGRYEEETYEFLIKK